MIHNDFQQITALLKREVVPAIGCTEPIAVALCVAKATEILGARPQKIEMHLSANVLKNAMGAGIPGTNMYGLPIAIALGTIVGKSAYQLEVLRDVNPKAVEESKQFIDEKRIVIKQKNTTEKLYIETVCYGTADKSTAIIAGGHTNFVFLAKNDTILLNQQQTTSGPENSSDIALTLRRVYDFAMEAPLSDIEFIMETAKVNKAAAEASFGQDYGHKLGRLLHNGAGDALFGKTTFTRMLSYTTGACDARMGGAPVPVMSNSGSGNQGISATLPVTIFAEENHNSHEQLVRALILSHLTVIYVKQSLGKLSALCGFVVTSIGTSCGLTYLMGGTYEQITFAVQNIIASITGMICDGAKPSCALKMATGTSTAALAAILAINNQHVSGLEGIVDNDVDQTIRNMNRIGTDSMNETDKLILKIMTEKNK